MSSLHGKNKAVLAKKMQNYYKNMVEAAQDQGFIESNLSLNDTGNRDIFQNDPSQDQIQALKQLHQEKKQFNTFVSQTDSGVSGQARRPKSAKEGSKVKHTQK